MAPDYPNYKRTKYSCYFSYLSMSSAFSLPPLLFLTFREQYGVSYTLLGTLVLVNFCTQMLIDLVFTFFSRHFNIKKTVSLMPLFTSAGLFIYAAVPALFPEHAYAGLLLGTVVFSVAAGLSEVLLSPIIASLPSDTPERDMSRLHSLYAYGVVFVIAVSTVFLKVFGTERWMYLTFFWALLPLISAVMFSLSPIPDTCAAQGEKKTHVKGRSAGLALCTVCILLGSAAENSMTNWISGFTENALGVPKITGDILGMALFAIFLGAGRTFYSKKGKKIFPVLLAGMAGAAVCYITAGLCPNSFAALGACVLTGLCTSMLWPGTLIFMEEKYPSSGVAAYALMAAGGDCGASIAPQLLGAVTDAVSTSSFALSLSAGTAFTPEQIGMKAGMLTAALFPLAGVFVLLLMKRFFGRKQTGAPDSDK